MHQSGPAVMADYAATLYPAEQIQIQHAYEADLQRTHCAVDMASSVCGGRRKEEQKNVRKRDWREGVSCHKLAESFFLLSLSLIHMHTHSVLSGRIYSVRLRAERLEKLPLLLCVSVGEGLDIHAFCSVCMCL